MKKLNKIFSMFLAILIVFSSLMVSVSAAGATLTVVSDVTDVKAGDTVTIDINLSKNSNLNCLTFDLIYDSSKLEYASHTLYDVCGVEEVNPNYSEGKIRFASAKTTAITAGTKILTVQFTVKSSACNTVSIEIIDSLDSKFNTIDTNSSPEVIHSYGEWSTKIEPTCENQGQKVKSCSCGNEITEIIDALNHNFATEYTVDKEPSCTETGSKSQHCSRCDSKQNVTAIPATEHNFGAWTTVTNPTCTVVGKEERTCLACGEKETQDINMVAHTEEEIPAVAPSCTETGLTAGVKCSVCGEILTAQTVVSANGHEKETIPAVAPSCTETGLTAGVKCSVCGEILTAQTVVSATEHDYAETITKVPTHTENGEKTFTCNNCGDTYTENIQADGTHKHIPTVTKEPTCTEKGVMTYTCACNDVYTEEISALGHTPADTVEENYVAPNCTDNGSKDIVVYCSVCDEELSRESEEFNALGHTEEILSAVAPTCTETGLTAGVKCSVCNEVLTAQTVVSASGHGYDADVTAPTCTDKGFTTYTCSVCDDSYVGDYTDSLGHNYSDGKCSECGSEDPDYFVFSIIEPSRTSIRNKDGIILHANVEGNRPDGSYVKWAVSNGNFKSTVMNDGESYKVIAENNGKTTFTATLYDVNGKVLATDNVELNSKSGFFDKIGGFFRSLFGATTVYEK